MIDTTVHDHIRLFFIHLHIHDWCHIISTGCCQKSSHLKNNLTPEIKTFQKCSELTQNILHVLALILLKIWDKKSRTILKHLCFKSTLRFQLPDKFIQMLQLCFHLTEIFLLSSGIELKSLYLNPRIICSVRNDFPDICFIYAKLISACHTDQHRNLHAKSHCSIIQNL